MPTQQSLASCRQKKIVILANFATNIVNGPYIVIENIALNAYNLGYRCELWGISTEEDINNYPFYRHFNDDLFKFEVSDKLKQQLIADRDDIACINLHSVFTPNNIAIARYAKSLGIALCLTPQGAYHNYSFKRNFLKKAIFNFLYEEQFLKSIDYFFVHGQQEENFIKRYSSKPCYTLLNGAPAINISKPARKKYIKEDGPLRMLFLGRLDPLHKGLDVLIKSLATFKNGEVKLTIAGPQFNAKAQAQIIELIARLGLSDTVTICGPVYQQSEKEHLYASHHLFVHTSRWEGVPTGVLEALLYGMPVLVSKETNLADAVVAEKLGLAVQNLTPEEVSEQIRTFLDNPEELNTFAENAYRKTPTIFNWASIAQQYVNYVLDECANKANNSKATIPKAAAVDYLS
ncbi:glycosyltransferase family 4 protein [Mucilaginibacter pallidiroseus]|uniref:Glycosyltransferase family 4 protein n=1 Tax=Mucilaginibacter pallidiroseus TaxID=2599295 RepID=A0A563UFD7_9SPHI|nr:glycosyltransferase family 4 protein [Mucilaginibacter pallidiroseus]TWR30016.1 glycosyltransferase family 4 protein [Mucilaginibacter pallidiroseus]